MFLEFEFLLDVLEVWCFFANKLEGNRRFISTPTPVPRFLLASRQSCHACSNAWCYGVRERDSEVINISLLSQRKYYNGFLFSQKQPFEMKRETSSGNERFSSKRNGEKLAALSLFSWVSLPKIYSPKFLQ